MSSLARRLVDECSELRPLPDETLDALRRAVLVEDVLDVQVADEQITLEFLGDPAALQQLPPASTTLS